MADDGFWERVSGSPFEDPNWNRGRWRITNEYNNGAIDSQAAYWERFITNLPTAPGLYFDSDNDVWIIPRGDDRLHVVTVGSGKAIAALTREPRAFRPFYLIHAFEKEEE